MKFGKEEVWAGLRIVLGWTFIWAFLDKLFGLGFATEPAKSWLAGGSPTSGYLQFATKGPLAGFFQSLAGQAVVDWLFMVGLLCLGAALILGISSRLAGYAGATLVLLMWVSALPPANNPIIDEHIIYALVLIGIARLNAGQWYGYGKEWAKFARKYPIIA